MDHDEFVDDLMSRMADSWDGDEGAESLVIEYVRTLEDRLIALGGSLERFDGGRTPALGEFYRIAREFAEGHGSPDDIVREWNTYVQVQAEAE